MCMCVCVCVCVCTYDQLTYISPLTLRGAFQKGLGSFPTTKTNTQYIHVHTHMLLLSAELQITNYVK